MIFASAEDCLSRNFTEILKGAEPHSKLNISLVFSLNIKCCQNDKPRVEREPLDILIVFSKALHFLSCNSAYARGGIFFINVDLPNVRRVLKCLQICDRRITETLKKTLGFEERALYRLNQRILLTRTGDRVFSVLAVTLQRQITFHNGLTPAHAEPKLFLANVQLPQHFWGGWKRRLPCRNRKSPIAFLILVPHFAQTREERELDRSHVIPSLRNRSAKRPARLGISKRFSVETLRLKSP